MGKGPWTKPTALARTTLDTETVRVGVAGDGSSLTIWNRLGGVRAVWRDARGRPGRQEFLTPRTHDAVRYGFGGRASLAVAESGTAVVLWTIEERRGTVAAGLYSRVRSRDGSLGPVRQVATSTDERESVFFGPSGHARLFWSDLTVPSAQTDGATFTATLDPMAGLGTHMALWPPAPSTPNIGDVSAAVDGIGNALIVGTTQGGAGQVFARTLSKDGVLGPILPVSAGGINARRVAVETNPRGQGYVVWSSEDIVQARSVSTGGVLGPVLTLNPGLAHAGFTSIFQGPQLAVFGDGNGIVVAARKGREIIGQAISPRRAGALRQISPKGDRGSNFPKGYNLPRITATGGRATVVWRYGNGKPYADKRFAQGIRARPVLKSGKLGKVTNIARPVGGSLINPPALASNAAGKMVAAWEINQFRGGTRGVRIMGSVSK